MENSERRKSFIFTYFNRPISRTQSYRQPYEYGKSDKVEYPCISGDYAEIDFTLRSTPQDDSVFQTAPSGLHQLLSIKDFMMECDVDSDYSFTNGCPDADGDVDFEALAYLCEKNAPGEEKWYHGMMDRTAAELFLSSEPWGTYLVRISPHHTSKYTLSVKTEATVKHFMIDTLYGEYYISIHKFPSLGSIVGYYTEVSPLLAGLYLKKPYPPSKAVVREKRLKAKASYTREAEQELSFKVGEKFLTNDILDCEDRSWIKVRKEKTDESGLALRVLLHEVPHDDELYEFEWFHGDITDEEAISTLLQEEVGAYLLNNRENTDYSMHVRNREDVNTSIIYQEGSSFKHNGKTYCSLNEMVNGYSRSNDFKLYPVPRKNRSKFQSTFSNKCQRDTRRASCQGPLTRENSGAPAYYLQTKNKRTNTVHKTKVSIQIVNGRVHFICNKKIEANISCADSKIYHVDKSVFNLPNPCYCILVTGTNGEHKSYDIEALSTETHELFNKWGLGETNNRRVQLDLKICQVKNLQQNGSIYCEFGFDGSVVYRTSEKDSNSSWNESHQCDTHNVAQSQHLNVTVVNNKRSTRSVVGECSILLTDLKQLEHSPQWYNLYNNKEKVGEIQLQHYYTDLTLLSSESYQSILEALRADSYSSMKGLGPIVQSKNQDNRDTLSTALLSACSSDRVSLVKQVAAMEIEQHPIEEPLTLLRGNSFATCLLKNFLSLDSCRQYVHDILEPVAKDLTASAYQFDTDDKEAEKWLQDRVERVVSDICKSASSCPLEVRKILSHILQCSIARWPSDENMKTLPVRVLVFLRLFCVGFILPKQFDFLDMENRVLVGMDKIGRSLTKISGNVHGPKRGRDLNLAQKMPQIEEFINELVDYRDTVHEDSQEPDEHDSAHLHNLLINNYTEIQAQSPNNESLKNLLLVLDKLQNE